MSSGWRFVRFASVAMRTSMWGSCLLVTASVASCSGANSPGGAPGSAAGMVCAGTPVACGLLSAEACAAAQGCASGACAGTAAPCEALATSTECILQTGCAPNGGACAGAALACSAFSSPTDCVAQRGCSWQAGCAGRATSCEALNASACVVQPGCHLARSSADAGAMPGNPMPGPEAGSRVCDDAAIPRALLVDDMEDRTQGIAGSDAYGTWYVYNDGSSSGHQTPAPMTEFEMDLIPGGRCASEYAMRMSGTGFNIWGAGMGFDLGYGNLPDGSFGKIPVDARAYRGVRFWARVGEATGNKALFSLVAGGCGPLGAPDASGAGLPADEAGVADSDGAADASDDATARRDQDCAQSFGTNLTLTTEWARYDLGFDRLRSLTGGAIPTDKVYSFEFGVPANTTFDLWIDDISWIPIMDP